MTGWDYRYHPGMKRIAMRDFNRLVSLLCLDHYKMCPELNHEELSPVQSAYTPEKNRHTLEKRLESLTGGRRLVPRAEDETEIHFQTLAAVWA